MRIAEFYCQRKDILMLGNFCAKGAEIIWLKLETGRLLCE
jgi:hypothetical protein